MFVMPLHRDIPVGCALMRLRPRGQRVGIANTLIGFFAIKIIIYVQVQEVIALLAFSPEGIARFEQDTLKRANLNGRKKRFALEESFHARVVLPICSQIA